MGQACLMIWLIPVAVIGMFLLNSSKELVVSALNTQFDELFKKYSPQLKVLTWRDLKSIAYIESTIGLNPRVARGLLNPTDIEGSKSYDGKSWGLMQVTLTTGMDYDSTVTAVKLNNPDYSVWIAVQHLKRLESIFNKSDPRFKEWVIKSYNQGQGNTLKEMKQSDPTKYVAASQYWKKFSDAYKGVA